MALRLPKLPTRIPAWATSTPVLVGAGVVGVGAALLAWRGAGEGGIIPWPGEDPSDPNGEPGPGPGGGTLRDAIVAEALSVVGLRQRA